MYCEKCGQQLRDGAKFCNKCGAVQNESPSTSDVYSDPSAKTTYKAKKRLPMKKIIAAIISMVLLAVGSMGLIIDFHAADTDRDLTLMHRAYQSTLEQYRDGIETLENENTKNNIPSMMIAFADVFGDEKDELIFLACESDPGTEKLHIFTFADDSAKEIISDDLFIYAGQGAQPFMLFTLKGDQSLWLYRQTGDETVISTYYHFEEDENHHLTKTEKYQKTELREGIPTTGVREWYKKDGKDCDKNTFKEADQYFCSGMEQIILVGGNLFDEAYRNLIAQRYGDRCLPYDEAIKKLNDNAESDPTASADQDDWESAYSDFLVNESFREVSELKFGDETEILVYLYDLDHDGIPELLITNGYSGRATRSAYMFTLSDNKVIYLGIGPGEPYCDPADSNSLLYANYWETFGVDHWYVYDKNGNAITTKESVNDPQLFEGKDGFSMVQKTKLSEIQADHMVGMIEEYKETNPVSEKTSTAAVSRNTGEQSPFTVKRMIFGLLAILGLGGSTVSMIVIVISKQAALTIITIIIYVTGSVSAVGGVTYSAVRNKVFVTSANMTGTANVDSDSIPSCKGMSAEQAREQLEKLGYTVKTEYSYSNSIPKDSVISQHTEEGTVLIVVIVVSRGPESDEYPATEKPSEKATETTSAKAPEGYAQKLTVTADKGSSYASAVLYEWKNGKWEKVTAYQATVGSNGIGDTIEGHRITPQGIHKLGVVLSAGSVNTNMNTYRVSSSTCVVDDPGSRYYNQIMDKSSIPSGTHYDNIGKGLTNGTTYATIYIEHNGTGFSSENVVAQKGSAIGVRGQYGELKPNLGDVDISAEDMKDLLSKLDINKTPMIEIKVN